MPLGVSAAEACNSVTRQLALLSVTTQMIRVMTWTAQKVLHQAKNPIGDTTLAGCNLVIFPSGVPVRTPANSQSIHAAVSRSESSA